MSAFISKVGAWFSKAFLWLKSNDRPRHILYGFLISLVLGFNAGLTAGGVAEFKNWEANGKLEGKHLFEHESGWSWSNFVSVLIGSLVGGLFFGLALKHIL